MLRLYPFPTSVTEHEGTFEFSSVHTAGIPNQIISEVYSEFGITLSNECSVNVCYEKMEGLSLEEYQLVIDENGARISFTSESGAFYGTQTLCQLIRMKQVPYLTIKDNPLQENRLLSLDISRGKLPTMDHFKEIIDYVAMSRYNILCLYYDRIIFQFPSLEGLWEKDAYTMDELRQIKQWCNEKHIRLMINVEGFGHLENFLKHDRFKHLSNSLDENNPGSDLNPLDPRSLEFVDMLLEDVMPFVDTEFIPVSVDEVASLETGKSAEEVKKRGKMVVFMEYANKLYRLVTEKYHKIPRFSGDMYLKSSWTDDEIREALKLFPKDAIVGDWGYEQEYEFHPFERNNRLLKEAGIKFENKAATGLFNQYIARTYNQTMNAEISCRMAYEHGGYCVAQSVWGDNGNSQFFVMELGGIFTFGSTAWNHIDFQLSNVLDFMDRYVFHSVSESLAELMASFGDAAWFGKGKVPCCSSFVFAANGSYDTTLLWKGYHAHTGISEIHLSDMVDEYGCKKALAHVKQSKKQLEAIELSREDGTILKEKIALNLEMFELAVRISYFKLCIHVLKDVETAKRLGESIKACYDDIFANFQRLWMTENREFGCDLFPNTLQKQKESFLKCYETLC